MDSPVIVDTTSQFGHGIDLDREFPGFPFEDEGFGRRSTDIRSHLDELAARHPEFAGHLLGSVWGDSPPVHSTGSLRNRRRRGSGSSSSYQSHPDEDARSQTSGSSATSAASGASGVSSHGDPSNFASGQFSSGDNQESSGIQRDVENPRRNPLPQYGLRNTVDIGQQRHEMDNSERANENRGQRSMSAPPENRQQNESPVSSREKQKPEQLQQNPNQRFVSRVDITPQFGQAPSSAEKPGMKSGPTNQQPKIPQQQSNVRHIPIFVEGRDEPVIPKNLSSDQSDGPAWTYSKPPRTESPPHFQANAQFPAHQQFHRPSHFNQHYAGGRARDWLPNFEEEFYGPQGVGFQHPGTRKHQQASPFASDSPPRQSHFRPAQTETRGPQQRQGNKTTFFDQPTQAPPQQEQQEPPAPPSQPRKQTQPKDPLEKVAEVQKEVDSLNEQVIQWNGKSRKEKEYMYLDEMLTRELIKLDDIETEGKENVRQARKNAIKSIQDSISLLESKAPPNEQPAPQTNMEVQQESGDVFNCPEPTESSMENDEKIVESQRPDGEDKLGPLPAGVSSPTNEDVSTFPEVSDTTAHTGGESGSRHEDRTVEAGQEDPANAEIGPVPKVSSTGSLEIRTNPETEQRDTTVAAIAEQAQKSSMDVENPKSPRTMKKARKAKKQQQQKQQEPISDGAIPLPPPETREIN